ncbi:hypothetical protein FOMG_19142 [Fusarium oxysporum f. sp. melonis 26406]|uniref:Uncharacterized protein n=1 Tax=Fusarium oxysporum f. sp. melonis 26406 TaxID=1089452 RepID=W9Z781_FUSOX|nr:hypothetical protein FOMG_19142 [Fusarium oxysporum f. sp. melonis 26406]
MGCRRIPREKLDDSTSCYHHQYHCKHVRHR